MFGTHLSPIWPFLDPGGGFFVLPIAENCLFCVVTHLNLDHVLFLADGCHNFFFFTIWVFDRKILGHFGQFRGHFWVILGHFGGFSGTVRFPHYSSRMVVITYFGLTFGFLSEKFWAILGSSGAFFGPFWGLFRNCSIPALFLADGCYNLFLFDF